MGGWAAWRGVGTPLMPGLPHGALQTAARAGADSAGKRVSGALEARQRRAVGLRGGLRGGRGGGGGLDDGA